MYYLLMNLLLGVTGNRLLLCRWKDQEEPERNTVTIRIELQKEYDLLSEQNGFFSAICYDGENKNRIWLTTNKGDLFLFCTDTSEIYKKSHWIMEKHCKSLLF